MASPSFLPYHALAPPEYHHERVESQPSSLSDADPILPTFSGVDLSWRPFYLRRRILFAFTIIFLLVIAAAETLLAVSDKNNGISSASAPAAQHYLWVYGPIATLTLIAAVWSRVEYQSKLVAPWIRLSKQPSDVRRTLLLDYISDFPLFVVFKALRNRDYTVSIVCAVSLIIRVMIVISSGLTTLSWTYVHHQSWPMVVQDRFIDSNSRLRNPGNLIPKIIRGLQKYNLTYPDGLSDTCTFQSIRPDLPAGAETRVTVDGFENSLKCKTAGLSLKDFGLNGHSYYGINVTVASSDCNVENLMLDAPNGPRGITRGNLDRPSGIYSQLFAWFNQIQCDGKTGDPGKRILVVFGNITYSPDPSKDEEDDMGNKVLGYQAQMVQSTQLLCIPAYEITKVDVVRNGTQMLSVTASPGATVGNLHSVTAWDMMESQFLPYTRCPDGHTCMEFISMPENDAVVDEEMSLAIANHIPAIGPIDSLFDAELLQQLVTSYYRKFAAISAKHHLMGPANINTSGSVVTYENRLVVQYWAAQSVAGLAAFCLGLAVLAMFFVSRHGILPCDPTTLPRVAFLVAWSHNLLERLRFSGVADTENLGHLLQSFTFESGTVLDPVSNQPHFALLNIRDSLDESRPLPQVDRGHKHPFVLHPASRLALCILLAALILILELILRQSNSNDGIGDMSDNVYIHYTWTVIPALFLGILAMVVSTVDFHVRSLAPYVALKRPLTPKTFFALDLLNVSTPRAILREIRGCHLGTLAGTLAFLVASLFPIPSTSLFGPVTIPIIIPTILRTNQSFPMYRDTASDANMVTSLILAGNLSFPRFTYMDLAFPQLVFTPPSLVNDNPVNISSLSVVAEVPALRSRLICRPYDASNIQTDIGINEITGDNIIGIDIEGEECRRSRYRNAEFNFFPNLTYFGTTNSRERGCSDFLYIWGNINQSQSPTIQHISAMGCNETIETLSVSTTFTGTTLDIDPRHPPKPLEHTAHPSSTGPFPGGHYNSLAWTNTGPENLYQFFAMLTSSPWAIPLSSLGDPTAIPTVIAAIKHQHGIIQTQNLAAQLVPANTVNATIPLKYPPKITGNYWVDEEQAPHRHDVFLNHPPGTTDDMPLYHGNATTAPGEGRRRVVQDPTSTRVLQGLLGTVLVLLLASWAGARETDVLPRAPTTIASAVALVAGGNLLGEDERDGFLRLLASSGKDGIGGVGDGGVGPGEDESVEVGSESEGKGGVSSWEGARFWMGWGTVPDVEGRRVGGENEGGASRFGIYVVWEKEEEEEEEGGGGDGVGREMLEKHVLSIGRWTLLRKVKSVQG